jgi:FkbM family methyltransferase
MSARIHNSIVGFNWPAMRFKPKPVTLAGSINICIVPHLGEFDQAALFARELDYEAPVFTWLAEYARSGCDRIIEIGANVGIYTVFLDALISSMPGSRLNRVIAFEPSRRAYTRLLENLSYNNTQHVDVFQAAVGLKSGFQSFFEPAGHLTNGSFVRDFAKIFSEELSETTALVIGPEELEQYFINAEKVLIKIDVEGFEPSLISALTPVIEKYQPDLLVEVLDLTVDQLNEVAVLSGYRKFLITPEGLREAPSLFASPQHRDWFLQIG